MTQTALISLAQQRLNSFIHKLYGKDSQVSPQTLLALNDFLRRGDFDKQFINFMLTCDDQEEELLQPKPRPPKTPEDDFAAKLIDLAREYPSQTDQSLES